MPVEITPTDFHPSEPIDDLIDLREHPDVYACLNEWATQFALDNNLSTTDQSQFKKDLINFEEHPDAYACLDEWAMRFDSNEHDHDNQPLEEDVVIITDSNKLIDIRDQPGIYECLGQWVSRFEESPKATSSLSQTVKPVDKCCELIEIMTETTETINAYQRLALWAKRFGDNADNEALLEDFHWETTTTITSDSSFGGDHAGDRTPLQDLRPKTTAIAASDIYYDGDNDNGGDDALLEDSSSEITATNSSTTDIFYDGKSKATSTPAATTPEQDDSKLLGTPLRLKTPEEFTRYHHLPRLWFYE